jgi:predicted thioredoxin/glutaredoxin
MKITKQQLRQIIKEEILKEVSYPLPPGFRKQIDADDIAMDLDMDTLMDPAHGPDWVYGELADTLGSVLDDETVAMEVRNMLASAARQGDSSVEYLANRLADLVNKKK